MSAGDWAALAERRGCAGLRIEGLPSGRTPTTPITASILAAIQVQEAVKLLHGIETHGGRGLVFDGLTNDLYSTTFTRSEDCNRHEQFRGVIQLPESTYTATANDILEYGHSQWGPGAQIELNWELLISLECPACGQSEQVLQPMARVPEKQAICPNCESERRPVTTQSLTGREPFANRPLAEIGIPPFDIISVRRGIDVTGFELSADASLALGTDAGNLHWPEKH
jgi:hypothetical protein